MYVGLCVSLSCILEDYRLVFNKLYKMGRSDEMRGRLALVVHLNQLKSEKSTLPVFVFLLSFFFVNKKM